MSWPSGRQNFGVNRVPLLSGLDSATGTTEVPVAVDKNTGAVLTSSGGSGDTQYTDGASVPANPIGTNPIFDNGGTWTHVSSGHPLPVSTDDPKYVDGGVPPLHPSGVPLIYNNGSGAWVQVEPTQGLPVAIESGNTQYTDGASPPTHPTGTLPIFNNGAGSFSQVGPASGLPVDIVAGTVGSSLNSINTGQQTVNTSAVQISSTSTFPTNGILVGGLSSNSASIFVGGSGVTTTTGVELQAGACLPFTCNLNTLYIISAASSTDKIWYSVL